MFRVSIRVKPGAARPHVGGAHGGGAHGGGAHGGGAHGGGAHGGGLVVAVSARAVDGRATEAALRAVATAFGVRRADVTLVTGRASRDKVIDIDGPEPELAVRLQALLGQP